MMEVDVGVAQVVAALNALSNPLETQQANEWLTNFQNSTLAWSVAEKLLNNPTKNHLYRFFGAKFFYSKIQSQFEQLNVASANSLKEFLVGRLVLLAEETDCPQNICLYVCLALAALALQINQEGIVNQILLWLNPIANSHPRIILILLSVLPEEAFNRNIHVKSDVRNAFLTQLSTSASQILQYLSQIWLQSTRETDKCQIFKCTKNWVELTELTIDSINNVNIIHICFSSLQLSTGDLFDSAVDACICILRRMRKMPLIEIEKYVQQIVQLKGRWSSSVSHLQSVPEDEKDEEVLDCCFSLCRLFSESAEILFDANNNGVQLFGQKELLLILIDCASFQYDHNVSRITFKFFYDLSIQIKQENFPVDQANQELYTTTFLQLLNVAVDRSRVPINLLVVNEKLPIEVEDRRMDWREVVLDCCDVIGSMKCMEILCSKIQLELEKSAKLNNMDWSSVEGILICMEKVLPRLKHESSDLFVQLTQFLCQLPSQLFRLQETAISILGQYSHWLKLNPQLLEIILVKLFGDLQNRSLCLCASSSIRDILGECSECGIPPEHVYNQFLCFSQGQDVLADAELNLLEGIIKLCSTTNSVQSENIFPKIVKDIQNKLIIAAADTNIKATGAQSITSLIDRLSVVFRSYKRESSQLVAAFCEVYPLLHSILLQRPSESVCEKICRCYKFAIRKCSDLLHAHLPIIIEHLVFHFASMKYSAFLYVGSICVTTFALSKEFNSALLLKMFQSFTNSFFQEFLSLENFANKPDVVEEYYFFVAKILQYCPGLFFDNGFNSTIILQGGIAGLRLKHRDAQKGILLFFERLIDLSASSTAVCVSAKSVMGQIGKEVMVSLFNMLGGDIPAYSLDESNGSITDVLWAIKRHYRDQFQAWLQVAVHNLPEEAQLLATKQGLVDCLISSSIREFSRSLDRFELSCRKKE